MISKRKIFLILILLLLASIIISLLIGSVQIITFKDGAVCLSIPENTAGSIFWQIRVPRTIAAILIGASLSVVGCALQAMLRNPLADPYTLGISGGAAFGATIGIIFKLGAFTLPFWAFFGALLTIGLIYFISKQKHFSIPTLILCGVTLSFLYSSLIMLMFSISTSDQVHNALFWLMGDLSTMDNSIIIIIAIIIVMGISVIFLFNKDLNLLTLGEEKALYLGIDPELTRKIIFLVSSLITGACVSASGIIGFVGLIVPHAVRRFTGSNHQSLIPASALAGACFLVLCDTFARIIIAPLELPVGVITGLVGGTVFLLLVIRRKKWQIF